jgi:hypothetical protein
MHSSLSGFLRAATENHFEGPIPAIERDRIRIVESAERAFDRSLPPLERSLKSLIHAYGDVVRDSALVEASRQLRMEIALEPKGDPKGRPKDAGNTDLYTRRTRMLAESAGWLAEKARQLADLARREGALE